LDRRNEELFISARQRLIEGVGPTVPYLPIIDKKAEILEQIKNNRVVVLSGGTGCGKSTQLPQYLLDSFALDSIGSHCNIIVTQPRRLAAVSLSDTVAGYRGEKVKPIFSHQNLSRMLEQYCCLTRRIQFCFDRMMRSILNWISIFEIKQLSRDIPPTEVRFCCAFLNSLPTKVI